MEKNSSADESIIRSVTFDFQQTNSTLQRNRTINTQDMGSFMLVAPISEARSYMHFYVERP